MKKLSIVVPLSLVILALFLASCSEDREGAVKNTTHVNGWNDPHSGNFFGGMLTDETYRECIGCHGQEFHPEGWADTTSAHFHGPQALASGNTTCSPCHGNDFAGGRSGQSCRECHQYPHLDFTGHGAAPHESTIAALGWDLSECSNCHGATFAGGRSGVSCLGCHTAENGPANCTTCHGLPPVNGETLPFGMFDTSAAGGHYAMAVEKGYACTECHPPVNDLSHTGPLPAEVTFAYASIATARGYTDTLYAHVGDAMSGNASCAVYCHSNGRGGPPNQAVPLWTERVELTCNSCHLIPPQAPHPQVQTCHNCHSNVDPTSHYPDDIRFLNEQLHVNGAVDL